MKRLRTWAACVMAVTTTMIMTGTVSGQKKSTVYCPAGFVSVMAFGAKGDGVTDDTMAFKWAVQSGKGIFVPAGEFRISETLSMDSCVMAGAGEGESIITFTGENPKKPIIAAGSYTSLRDLTIRFADGLVTGEESEALGVFIQQHRAEVAVAETDLALIGNRAGDAERLQAFADALGGFGSGLDAFLHRDRRAQLVSPLHVLEADRLGALHDGIRIHALGVGVGLHFVKVLEAILVKHRLELRHTTFIVFKKSHCFARLLLICPSADQSTSQRRPPP